MNHTETPNKPPAPSTPPDLLTAAALKYDIHVKPPPVAIDDIVAAMREFLHEDRLPDFETMLAAQAFAMNIAFNRLIAAGLDCSFTSAASGQIDVALRVQRRVCDSLNTLRRLRADQAKSGKGTEGP